MTNHRAAAAAAAANRAAAVDALSSRMFRYSWRGALRSTSTSSTTTWPFSVEHPSRPTLGMASDGASRAYASSSRVRVRLDTSRRSLGRATHGDTATPARGPAPPQGVTSCRSAQASDCAFLVVKKTYTRVASAGGAPKVATTSRPSSVESGERRSADTAKHTAITGCGSRSRERERNACQRTLAPLRTSPRACAITH